MLDYLIEINNIITASNNVTLGKGNVNPYGYDNMYMNKGLIEDKLYQIIGQFNERKTTPVIQYFVANDNKTIKLIDKTKK